MYMEVCGNGYSQNIVTTSLFMTLVFPLFIYVANGASSSNLQLRNKNKTDQFRPYVILEMDHPAQKYNTKMATDRRKGLNGSLDFSWSSETRFQL